MGNTYTPKVMESSSTLHLRAKTKDQKVLIREMLFADDTALTAHNEEALQLIRCFTHTEFH